MRGEASFLNFHRVYGVGGELARRGPLLSGEQTTEIGERCRRATSAGKRRASGGRVVVGKYLDDTATCDGLTEASSLVKILFERSGISAKNACNNIFVKSRGEYWIESETRNNRISRRFLKLVTFWEIMARARQAPAQTIAFTKKTISPISSSVA